MTENPYNCVDYPGHMRIQAHPRRMETVARLHGLRSPPAAACRLLELGCGDGAHVIAVAAEFPDCESFGYDLAESGIQAGLETITRLGLANAHLAQGDITTLADQLAGQHFDYIVAHGVYSWVPFPVRDALMALCGQLLSENGVAFISHHVLPGGHIRRMVDEMLLYHVRHLDSPTEKVAAAREFSRLLAESRPKDSLYGAILRDEQERLSRLEDFSVFHDNLADCNEPSLFADFVAHAGRHGLQYLGDADFRITGAEELPPGMMALLQGRPRLEREQYLDFWSQRAFRHTLLCRSEHALPDDEQPQALEDMWLAGRFSCDAEGPARLNDGTETTFHSHISQPPFAITVNQPALKQALVQLSRAWPASLSFDAWLGAVHAALSGDAPDAASLRAALRTVALRGMHAGILEAAVTPVKPAVAVSPRPQVWPLARLQAASGPAILTLVGRMTHIEDGFTRRLMVLLDGSRDLDDLVRELGPYAREAPSLMDTADPVAALPAALEQILGNLANHALLLA